MELHDRVKDFVERTLEAMGLSVDVAVSDSPDGVRVDVSGDEGEVLLRRRAEALDALQHIVNTAFRRELDGDRALTVDCLDYRKGKDAELKQMARFLMEKAKTTRTPQEMGPLNPYARRLVHLTVAEDPQMSSESIGDAFLKTVIISSAEVSCGGWNRHCRSGRDVQHDRYHRCHRHASRPWRDRGRSHERAERCDDCAGDDGTARAIRVRAMPHSPTSTVRSNSIDRVVVTFFAAPHSYTGEDVAEISAHGSPVLLRAIVSEAMRNGARLAEPGEFTLRAYLNQRIDLVQAEAVRDLVNAVTPLQARAAFDQLEGTLTADIREIDRALLDLTARLEASLDFPGEGYHFVEGSAAAGEIAAVASRVAALLEERATGPLDPRGAARGARGPAQHRQVVAVQRARRRGPGDRHRRARDDT